MREKIKAELKGLWQCAKDFKLTLSFIFGLAAVAALGAYHAIPHEIERQEAAALIHPATIEKIAGLETEVGGLTASLASARDAQDMLEARLEEEQNLRGKLVDNTEAAFAAIGSLLEPEVFAQQVLAARKTEAAPDFHRAYTLAVWQVEERLGIDWGVADLFQDAAKSLIFADGGEVLAALLADGIGRDAMLVVASGYMEELGLFRAYPKLLESFDRTAAEVVAGVKANDIEGLRAALTVYGMQEAGEVELQNAHFFLKFLVRRLHDDPTKGTETIAVLLALVRDVVATIPGT